MSEGMTWLCLEKGVPRRPFSEAEKLEINQDMVGESSSNANPLVSLASRRPVWHGKQVWDGKQV